MGLITPDTTDVKQALLTLLSEFNGLIDNNNIALTAAIAYAKLNLTGSIVNADISASAAIDWTKLASPAWTDWTPSYGAGGSMTWGSVSTTVAKYIQIGATVFYQIQASGTTGGTASDRLTFTLPVARSTSPASDTPIGTGGGNDSSALMMYVLWSGTSKTTAAVRKYDDSNFALGAGRTIRVTGFYEVA